MQQQKTLIKFIFPLIVLLIAGAGCAEEKQKIINPTTQQTPLETAVKNMIQTKNQSLVRGIIEIPKIVSVGPGWAVIHADKNGQPGEVLGQTQVRDGENVEVTVKIDESKVTSKLYVMLHVDAGQPGIYEFPGADIPATEDGVIVNMPFDILPNDDQTQVKTNDVQKTITEENTDNTVKEFSLTAKKWSFEPKLITVNKGDHVKLTIESVDVTHGFSIPDFGINQTLKPGEAINVEFIADKTGNFSFFCSVFCGEGHTGMNGTLTVK